MSRWCEREEREPEKPVGNGGPEESPARSGGEARPRITEASDGRPGFGANRREWAHIRNRTCRIRPSERAVLDVLGRFRVVDADDLLRGLYGEDRSLGHADLEALRRQGLITAVKLRDASGRESRVLALTRDGHDLARARAADRQEMYWGYAKPDEVQHDAHLYSAYRHEERHLQAEGCAIKQVVLDYALKRDYFARLNGRPATGTYWERQAEAAKEVQLPVIDGHVVFPDFRIEYEDERGAPGRVDVEVATGNYRDCHIDTKGAAGFRVYADADVAARFGVSASHLGGGGFISERSALLLL